MKILSFAKCKTAIAIYLFSAVISCGYLITPVRESIAQAVQSVVGLAIFNTSSGAFFRVGTIGQPHRAGNIPIGIPIGLMLGCDNSVAFCPADSFGQLYNQGGVSGAMNTALATGVLIGSGSSGTAGAMGWRSANLLLENSNQAPLPPVVNAVWGGLSDGSANQLFPWQRAISATTLTETTSLGSILNVPLSTWSVTHTPAAPTQATISKAAGGGTVRHVATSITACSAQGATAQTPIAINLRNGATGAGTIIRSWKISTIIQDSKCVDLSGLAMIGSANTAMTIEFAAAGVAASEQTVTLTGFSTP